DEAELRPKPRLHLVWYASRITFCRAFPGQPLQRLLRRLAIANCLLVIAVGELIEPEADPPNELLRLPERFRMFAKQPGHFLGGLDMALGILLKPTAGLKDRDVLANAGDDVLQHPPFRDVVEHIVDG